MKSLWILLKEDIILENMYEYFNELGNPFMYARDRGLVLVFFEPPSYNYRPRVCITRPKIDKETITRGIKCWITTIYGTVVLATSAYNTFPLPLDLAPSLFLPFQLISLTARKMEEAGRQNWGRKNTTCGSCHVGGRMELN